MKIHSKWLAVIIIVALGAAPAWPQSKGKMFLVVNFDVEDYITPESERIDDIPRWLAQIMAEEGVTGTFFVIGEKARSLEKRGRRDVIAAMAKHDIGSHTNFGSIHPTVTEQLEKADWQTGFRLMLDQESAGVKDLERIFGTAVRTMARHGGSYGPQLIGALSKMNVGYAGSPVNLPGSSVVWFCNALNFYGQYDGFDDTYYRDDLFDPHFEKLKEELPKLAQTVEVLPFFAGHPTKIRAEQFWDFNFYDGKNPAPGEWKAPALRPMASMKTAQKNFRRLVRYLKSRDDLEITTFGSLMALYSDQKEILTAEELCEIARSTLQDKAIVPSESFSPAEAFAGLAKSITDEQDRGSLPQNMKVIRPYGPLEMPVSRPEISHVTFKEASELARKADDYIRRVGSLPSFVTVRNGRIGTGSLFALFCAVFLDMNTKSLKPECVVPTFDPYPKTNENDIVQRVKGFKSWPVHRPDLGMRAIVEMTKLQLWTLKPAHKK